MLPRLLSSVLKKHKRYYSGKKKRHTLKTQVVVDKVSKLIICTAFGNGSKHDFNLFKASKTYINPVITSITDTGYIGINKFHTNSLLPRKNTKHKRLSKADKSFNRSLSSVRSFNENVIGSLKRFKIIADKYRNRRKRFKLRVNLIAGIYYFENKNNRF